MMTYITKIQKYSVHDGNGIRTTIFFKGCPLACSWCHNPETQCFDPQLSIDFERCVGCNSCQEECEGKVINKLNPNLNSETCISCGKCIDYCNLNLREITGREYPVRELVKEIQKDEIFYDESGGGVTLSGGEVMSMNIDYIYDLVKALDKKGISINIDTSGYTDFENFEKIHKHIDTFLYDLKAMDNEVHKQHIGVDNTIILENLIKLNNLNAKINLRLPLIKGINANDEFVNDVVAFLKKYSIDVTQINLLPYHNTGSSKYKRIGLDYEWSHFSAPSVDEMNHFKNIFYEAGYKNTKIGG